MTDTVVPDDFGSKSVQVRFVSRRDLKCRRIDLYEIQCAQARAKRCLNAIAPHEEGTPVRMDGGVPPRRGLRAGLRHVRFLLLLASLTVKVVRGLAFRADLG